MTLNVGALAGEIEAAIGGGLKTSDFKDKKLSLVAVLFLSADPNHLRTTRVLGEIPIEITLADGEIAALGTGAAAGLASTRRGANSDEIRTVIRMRPSAGYARR